MGAHGLLSRAQTVLRSSCRDAVTTSLHPRAARRASTDLGEVGARSATGGGTYVTSALPTERRARVEIGLQYSRVPIHTDRPSPLTAVSESDTETASANRTCQLNRTIRLTTREEDEIRTLRFTKLTRIASK